MAIQSKRWFLLLNKSTYLSHFGAITCRTYQISSNGQKHHKFSGNLSQLYRSTSIIYINIVVETEDQLGSPSSKAYLHPLEQCHAARDERLPLSAALTEDECVSLCVFMLRISELQNYGSVDGGRGMVLSHPHTCTQPPRQPLCTCSTTEVLNEH